MAAILASSTRSRAGPTAPAHGLQAASKPRPPSQATQLPSEPGRRWWAVGTAPPARDQSGAAAFSRASAFCQHGAKQLRSAV